MKALLDFDIVVNEISVKMCDVPGDRFDLAPAFSKETGLVDQTHVFVRLTIEIRNTKEHPFPAEAKVTVTGIFKVSGEAEADHEVEQFLNTQGLRLIFPYARSILSSVTANAMIPPIVLPVIDVRALFDDTEEQ